VSHELFIVLNLAYHRLVEGIFSSNNSLAICDPETNLARSSSDPSTTD